MTSTAAARGNWGPPFFPTQVWNISLVLRVMVSDHSISTKKVKMDIFQQTKGKCIQREDNIVDKPARMHVWPLHPHKYMALFH